MRYNSVRAAPGVERLGHIAVGAENLEIGRVAMISEPQVEPVASAAPSHSSVVLNARPHATTINMIKDQEGVLGLTATGAASPIGVYGGLTETEVPIPASLVAALSILFTVLTNLLKVGLVILPRFFASAIFARGNRPPVAAVEQGLWLSEATSVTVLHVPKATIRAEAWEQAYKIQKGQH